MNQLKHAVAVAFDNIVASGTIEAAIQEQIGKSIASAIKDQIGGYNSEFSKKINERVKSLIDVNLDEIDLPSYRQLIADIIKQRVGAVMSKEFTEQLDKDISELLQPAPAEITLEQLLEEFTKYHIDYYGRDDLRGNKFTLAIEWSDRNDGYVDVFIDKDANTSNHICDIHLRIRNGEIWGLKLNGDDFKRNIFAGPLFNFEKWLFQMYTAKTRLIIDANADAGDFDTTFPYNDNDND